MRLLRVRRRGAWGKKLAPLLRSEPRPTRLESPRDASQRGRRLGVAKQVGWHPAVGAAGPLTVPGAFLGLAVLGRRVGVVYRRCSPLLFEVAHGLPQKGNSGENGRAIARLMRARIAAADFFASRPAPVPQLQPGLPRGFWKESSRFHPPLLRPTRRALRDWT